VMVFVKTVMNIVELKRAESLLNSCATVSSERRSDLGGVSGLRVVKK
jgi:hypothetical protein